jgi:GNAT superfamily N-acetyltransferase
MSDTDGTQKSDLSADLVPVRWWQAIPFLRLNLEIVRGIDPLADRILTHPWAPSSLLEYGFMLHRFFRSNAHFVFISGEQAGLLWTVRWSEVFFIITLGLFPRYQQHGVGTRTINLAEDYARSRQCKALATAVAPRNKPVLLLIKARGGNPLGLATTTLNLSTANPPTSSSPAFEIRHIGKRAAREAWKRWRLYEVEQVAGLEAVQVAVEFLHRMPLPRAKYMALYQDGQEIGFAFARHHSKELEVGAFPTAAFWSAAETTRLVATLATHLGAPVHYLVLTQSHANTFANAAPFEFERHCPEEERHFAYKWIADS